MGEKLISSVFLVLLLGGCSAFFNMDKSISQCSNSGKKNPCISARSAYYASQGYDPDAELAAAEEGRSKRKRGNMISPFSPQPVQHNAGSGYPRPLMNQTKVMRVWINSYEDEDGNLVYPTRVYTEIEQKKWDTGYSLKRSGNKGKRVTPLVAQQQSVAEKQEPPEKVAESVREQDNSESTDGKIPQSLPQGLIALD